MQLKEIIIIIVVAISIVCFACIKQVNVKIRNEKPILVVEGAITTDTIPYTVKLSYTGPFTTASQVTDEYFEKDAQVSVTDDQGNTTKLVYKDKGIYETIDPSYIGKTGRSYN